MGDFIIKKDRLVKYTGRKSRVIIPRGVRAIDCDAFSCSNVTEVIIPLGVEYIGRRAFEGCKNLKKVMIAGSVRTIASAAFRNCKSLEEINIPFGIKRICHSVFWGCESLQQIKLPENLTTIEVAAFYGSGLRSLVIPKRVTAIKSRAVSHCVFLDEIRMECEAEIAPDAFTDFRRTYILIDDINLLPQRLKPLAVKGFMQNPDFGSEGRAINHCSYISKYIWKLLKTVPDIYELLNTVCRYDAVSPETLEELISMANSDEDVEALVILLEYSNKESFKLQCEERQAYVEDMRNRVSDRVLRRAMEIDRPVSNFLFTGEFNALDDTVLKCLAESGEIVIMGKLSEEVDYVVKGSRYPDMDLVNEAESYGIPVLSEKQFNLLSNRPYIESGGLLCYSNDICEDLVIGDEVHTIGENAFVGSQKMKNIVIGPSVTSVCDSGLSCCDALEKVVFNSERCVLAPRCFAYDSKLKEVILPKRLRTIKRSAFSYCVNLDHIDIPPEVTSIGNTAFSFCMNLKRISIPESVRSISHSAFFGTRKLVMYVVPGSFAEKYAKEHKITYMYTDT